MMDDDQCLRDDGSIEFHTLRRWGLHPLAVFDGACARKQRTEPAELGQNLDGIRKTPFKYRAG
jgi:hypothetical protein